MSALLSSERMLVPMTVDQLDAVLAIETTAYEFPWTRGNFVDSLAVGHLARMLVDERASLLGYYIAMEGVDEVHLLNLTVAPHEQGQGHARCMLDDLSALCRKRRARQLWLEVRLSNARARDLYERYGFKQVGVRRGYYPAPLGRREDAAVMSLVVPGSRDGLE